MTDFVWIKYREKWNSGYGKWEWQEFNKAFVDSDYEEYFIEKGEYNNLAYSDAFRGYEWHIEEPPVEVVEKRIKENLRSAEMYEWNAVRLTSYLEKRNETKSDL